jgi:hypothetical protein
VHAVLNLLNSVAKRNLLFHQAFSCKEEGSFYASKGGLMLSPEGILLWYSNQNTSTDSRNLIDRIRTSEPSRRVGNGASNVSGRYPSKKMGRVIQFETHRVELAGIYEMENDPDVLEFYDQPQPVMLSYPNQTGIQQDGTIGRHRRSLRAFLKTTQTAIALVSPEAGPFRREKHIQTGTTFTTMSIPLLRSTPPI